MGLCYSIAGQAPCSGRLRTYAEEDPIKSDLPLENVGLTHSTGSGPDYPSPTVPNDSVQRDDCLKYFQKVRLKSHAFVGESGCFSFSGSISMDDGATQPVIVTLAIRNMLNDDMLQKLHRLVTQIPGQGLLQRLAFFTEHIVQPVAGLHQGTFSSKLFPAALNGVVRSYGGVEVNSRPIRPVQYNSCPAISGQRTGDHKDMVLCISSPCVSPTFAPSPTSQLALQNSDIAAAMSYLPLVDGNELVAGIDVLPSEVYGNLLQAIQFLQARSYMSGITNTLLMYALQVARAMAALHDLRVHHGCLTPIAVLLVTGEKESQHGLSHAPAPCASKGRAMQMAPPSDTRARAMEPGELQCKLALYGLVNPIEHAGRLAHNAAGWGAVSYMAPECFTADPAAVTQEMLERMDVHAFGALCYHIFTGVAPYSQYHAAQVLVGLSAGGLQLVWPPPDGRRAPVPEFIQLLVSRCLDRNAESRPPFPEIVLMLESLRKEGAF